MVEHSIVGSEWSFGCRMMDFPFRRRMLQVLWDGSCVFHLAPHRALGVDRFATRMIYRSHRHSTTEPVILWAGLCVSWHPFPLGGCVIAFLFPLFLALSYLCFVTPLTLCHTFFMPFSSLYCTSEETRFFVGVLNGNFKQIRDFNIWDCSSSRLVESMVPNQFGRVGLEEPQI